MSAALIGRKAEQETLDNAYASKRPEFIALYGRRRVGKTFLIRQCFDTRDEAVFFNSTGTKDGALKEQIAHFSQSIGNAFFGGVTPKPASNWDRTFALLTQAMTSVPKSKKIVLFFDELPWMATKNSHLLQTLDYYWNQYWSNDGRIKLIVCGSSASWIIDKIINNKGGLHNRITRTIQLNPFDLPETAQFLAKQGLRFNPAQVLQLYMAMGGIPYYLAAIAKGSSAAQAIEKLAFRRSGLLLGEFDKLFSSLFADAAPYIELLRLIAATRHGIAIKDIVARSRRFSKGGRIADKLEDLKRAGFVLAFKPYQRAKKGIYYRVIDEYTLFYLDWIEPVKDTLQEQSLAAGYWQGLQQSAGWHAWAGYAFEAVCFKHLPAIRRKLEIPPTAITHSWRYVPAKSSKEDGAQVDLLFDRRDEVITLCEIKYSNKPFVIDKAYARTLETKARIFAAKTKTKKQIMTTMIAAHGVAENLYSDNLLVGTVTLDDLFTS
jgi:uncharacterized protein